MKRLRENLRGRRVEHMEACHGRTQSAAVFPQRHLTRVHKGRMGKTIVRSARWIGKRLHGSARHLNPDANFHQPCKRRFTACDAFRFFVLFS